MNWLDPLRPQLPNARPCWLTDTRRALPGWYIEPDGDSGWLVQVMLDGVWAARQFDSLPDLFDALLDWRDDPEGAIVRQFGRQPPQARVPSKDRTAATPEPGMAIAASVEDLGL